MHRVIEGEYHLFVFCILCCVVLYCVVLYCVVLCCIVLC